MQRALLPPMSQAAGQRRAAPRSSAPAALPRTGAYGAASAGSGPRFDLSVKDMPARDFFLGLMEESRTNIVVNPDVTGTISFALNNVSLEQVLNAVRDSHGYDYRRTPYGYQIFSNGVLTRTFNVNFLNIKRKGVSETSISSGQTSETTSKDSGGTGTSESSTSSVANSSFLQTTTEGDFWGQLQAAVTSIIGEGEGRSVVVDGQSGLLVVRAPITSMQQVERFLDEAERNLRRQVILEAKIMEVRLADGYQAGINWTSISNDLDSNGEVIRADTSGADFNGEYLNGLDKVGGVFSTAFRLGGFTGVMQLLETQGDVRVLSSPRIATTNNQKAVIKVGTDEFFITEVKTENTSTATATTSQPEVVLTPFFSGIALDVTPQIDANNEITLHIKPQVTKTEEKTRIVNLGAQTGEYQLPTALSTIRESDSIIRARSGEVVVLGGLLQDDSDNQNANVPWFSKLPVVGPLFKQTRRSLSKSELVILLRPTVVDSNTWVNELQRSAERFRAQPREDSVDDTVRDVFTQPAPTP